MVGFSIGGNFNRIRFKNSEGVVNGNLKGLPGAAVAICYQSEILRSKTERRYKPTNFLSVELGYKSGQFTDKGSQVLTTWSLNYLSTGLAFKHYRSSKKNVNPFYAGGFISDFLISGVQSRGFEQYDLTEDIKKINLSITAEAGLLYTISDKAHCSLSLAYLRGLSNLEKDSDQKAMIHAWKLSATVFFNLKKEQKQKK
jgi:hypothetical protein